ncbi:MAG: tRNA (guanosine(46)-N7)-methyltransferase TrmB [Flavobacteriales bacterium]|nr:tRNA (guanosine(46)-N7)-methyltransferase TrmB [Flavobacteriales bacterium]
MGKDKLRKWKENAAFSHVFEPDLKSIVDGAGVNKGKWAREVFGNDHPITLELGCGKGEYTVGLARRHPDRNFIGVDIKGHRFWRGAKTSQEEGLNNVAFLRTKIEFVQNFFVEGEVSEIWLTFSDPQPKDEKGTKRITSERFLERYRGFMVPGGLVHVKSDSPLLYALSKEGWEAAGFPILEDSADVYGDLVHRVPADFAEVLNIRTYYEARWLEEGKKIHYLRTRV